MKHFSTKLLILLSLWVSFYAKATLADPANLEALLFERADNILQALQSKDWNVLNNHVHEIHGLKFSPYVRNLTELPITHVAKADLIKLAQSDKKRTWGTYDGSGAPIKLALTDYMDQFVYDLPYTKQAKRFFWDTHTLSHKPDFKALYRAYPCSVFVYYQYTGTAETGFMDFKDLILVFSEFDKQWHLTGIAHGENTI